jgi:RHS repeat-associated protein
MTYCDDNNNGIVSTNEIKEENHYYPYGLKHVGYGASSTSGTDAKKYQFNGKEWQDEEDLNLTAMDFRMYDNALGRFYGMDALSEKNHYLSPFQFGNGNPVFWADPTGLDSGMPGWMQDLWDATPNGYNTTWTNNGNGEFELTAFWGTGQQINQSISAGSSSGGGGIAGFGIGSVYNVNTGLLTTPNGSNYYNFGNNNWSKIEHLLPGVVVTGRLGKTNVNYNEITSNINAVLGNGNNTKGYDFSRIDTILGFGGIAYDALELSIAWKGRYWLDARGNYQSISRLSRGTNGRYLRGVQGYRNGYNSALRTAGRVSKVGNAVGLLGLGVTAAQYYGGHITGLEASVDAAFGIIGFFGPVGAIISATYFVGKLGYEYFSGDDLFDKPE